MHLKGRNYLQRIFRWELGRAKEADIDVYKTQQSSYPAHFLRLRKKQVEDFWTTTISVDAHTPGEAPMPGVKNVRTQTPQTPDMMRSIPLFHQVKI